MNDFSVYCLKYAESVLPESAVFLGGSKEKSIPISFAFYFIKTSDKNILIDAGCDYMPDFDMKRFYSPSFVLRQMELSADEITDVVITHSHHDHIEGIKHFKNAKIHISKNEYDSGRSYIINDNSLNIFENEFILCPQIKIIEWRGHSEGSSVVEIKTDDKIHVLAGDECYTNENILNNICTGSTCNKERSIEFLNKYSNEKYIVHTCHDISLKTERIL